MNVASIMFALLRFGIDGTTYCGEEITAETLPALYKLSKSHDLAHLVAHALDKLGALPEGSPARKAFLQERNMAVFRYEQIQYEYQHICSVFERENIEYIPLKGSVMRTYYPEPWMRTSCDIDVLVKEEELNRAVKALEQENYTVDGTKEYHDISLYSEGGVHLELHHNICETMDTIDKLLLRVWEFSVPVGDTSKRLQSSDYFVFHNVAHLYYHFVKGGCGVRTLLDLWILKNRVGYDEKQLETWCKDCSILTFYNAVLRLTQVWFAGAESDELTDEMSAYILGAGTYGSQANSAAAAVAKKGSRFKVMLSYIFVPRKVLQHSYPVLKKHGWLTFFCNIHRCFKRLFQGKGKRAAQRLKTTGAQSNERVEKMRAMFDKLDI